MVGLGYLCLRFVSAHPPKLTAGSNINVPCYCPISAYFASSPARGNEGYEATEAEQYHC